VALCDPRLVGTSARILFTFLNEEHMMDRILSDSKEDFKKALFLT